VATISSRRALCPRGRWQERGWQLACEDFAPALLRRSWGGGTAGHQLLYQCGAAGKSIAGVFGKCFVEWRIQVISQHAGWRRMAEVFIENARAKCGAGEAGACTHKRAAAVDQFP